VENLPQSVLVKDQKIHKIRIIGKKKFVVKIRYDDQCGNGHNTFSITSDLYVIAKNSRYVWDSGGCQHDLVKRFFPELKKYIRWHLTSSDGPMHYIANTLFHAGDKDCWGGKKGETKAYRYNVMAPNGNMVFRVEEGQEYKLLKKEEAEEMAARIIGVVVPVPWLIHEGKERDLDAARRCAVWLEATDEELMAPDLKEKLLARLPGLMEEFKQDVEELGFVY
jgi:hypothetical protein